MIDKKKLMIEGKIIDLNKLANRINIPKPFFSNLMFFSFPFFILYFTYLYIIIYKSFTMMYHY